MLNFRKIFEDTKRFASNQVSDLGYKVPSNPMETMERMKPFMNVLSKAKIKYQEADEYVFSKPGFKQVRQGIEFLTPESLKAPSEEKAKDRDLAFQYKEYKLLDGALDYVMAKESSSGKD